MDENSTEKPLDLGAIVRKLANVSARPSYAFLVLNLISEAADAAGLTRPPERDNTDLDACRRAEQPARS